MKRSAQTAKRPNFVKSAKNLKFQAAYYMEYFTKISTDLTHFIDGSQAANLFKKSNLSLDELCVIWELADLDKGKLLNRHNLDYIQYTKPVKPALPVCTMVYLYTVCLHYTSITYYTKCTMVHSL